MQKVNIYIDVYFRGKLNNGTGTYGIVLEYIKAGVPYTREYIGGYEKTTRNRTAINACIEALNYLIRSCKVNITINSKFVYQAITQEWYKMWIKYSKNKKGGPANNIDLWQQLADRMKKHEFRIEYQPTNQYSTYMYTQIKKSKIEYKEDDGNV